MKRNINSYTIFVNERRDDVKASLLQTKEKVTIGEVMKELGRLWKDLGEEEKQTYKTKATEMRDVQDNNFDSEEKGEDSQSDIKAPRLAATAVRKIMLENEKVNRISPDGVKAMTVVTEMFIEFLTEKSYEERSSKKKTTIDIVDIEAAVAKHGWFDSSDIKDRLKALSRKDKRTRGSGEGKAAKKAKKSESDDDTSEK